MSNDARKDSQVADAPRPPSEYRSDGLLVLYEGARCIHAEECTRGVPNVFDRKARPWIQPDRASADDIADAIQQCPSGALTFKRLTFGSDEHAEEPPRIIVIPNGPLYVRGDVEYPTQSGERVRSLRAALCRCGGSASKPFCDNAHLENGFQAP